MTYLKDKSYYIERYDRLTIDECRRSEKHVRNSLKKDKATKGLGKTMFSKLAMYFITGERYRYKDDTIGEWMNRDRERDRKLGTATVPDNISCLGCSSLMACNSSDLLEDTTGEERVLFFFSCPECGKRRGYWDDGKEWQPKPILCPVCKTPMASVHTRKGSIVSTTLTCPNCDHSETDTLNLKAKPKVEKVDPRFEADRKKYCLSDKEGLAYVMQADTIKRLGEEFKEKEDHKEAYETLAKIKKLAIADLKSMLLPRLKKAGYWKLDFGPPEIRRGVIVPFTLQDQIPGRTNYDSISTLTRLLDKALDNTNWHLTSDSVSYQLGLLNGRLKGIEDEHALLEQVKRKIARKNKVKKKNRTTNKTRPNT